MQRKKSLARAKVAAPADPILPLISAPSSAEPAEVTPPPPAPIAAAPAVVAPTPPPAIFVPTPAVVAPPVSAPPVVAAAPATPGVEAAPTAAAAPVSVAPLPAAPAPVPYFERTVHVEGVLDIDLNQGGNGQLLDMAKNGKRRPSDTFVPKELIRRFKLKPGMMIGGTA